jgi:phosphopantothenoylcysteine decarboxylase/phosphopantothenate--cysteine ligase
MKANGLTGKNVILCVCGGIAAYKSVELLRLLVKSEAMVRVILTRSAQAFVGPLTFEALSGNDVCTSLFEGGSNGEDAAMRHIYWAQEADVVIIAPATANLIGKLANGVADDALSTFMMAVTCPVLMCPSMNTNMYCSPAVQRNLQQLKEDGLYILEPGAGELACKTVGKGRLPEPEVIYDRARAILTPKDLAGRSVLVTAGPTQEPIDPVRFISNPSSGKMGYAIARAAEQRGAAVTLISGPSNLAAPIGVDLVRVQTSEAMAQAVFEHYKAADIIVKAAAVSDYRSEQTADQKIKKDREEMVLALKKTRDILKEIGRRKEDRFLVGFAAETENLERNAADKLKRKNLDMIVANLVGRPDSGFGTDTNIVTFFFRDGRSEQLSSMEKEEIAHLLLDRVAAALDSEGTQG